MKRPSSAPGFHKHILDRLEGMIYVCSPEYRIEFMNARFIAQIGRDATGEPCYSALHDRKEVCPWCQNDRVFAGETVRWRVKSPRDGKWYENVNSLLLWEGGGASKLCIAQEAVEPEHSLFKALVDNLNDAIFFLHPRTGQIVFANDRACKNLGYSREELLRMTVLDYAGNVGELADWHRLVERVRLEGFAVFETEQARRDGSLLPVEVNITLARPGRDEFLVSVARDITERKRAETCLEEERGKVAAVMEAIGDGITVQDRDFRILYQNAVHIRRQGRHLGEYCYRAYQGRDAVCEGCLVEKSFADGRIHRRETCAETGEGTIHFEVSSCPLKNAEGEVTACVEVVRDITEKKESEQELARLKEDFISGFSHEMSTPLTAMIGFAEFLIENELEREQQKEYLGILLKESDRLKGMIDNLLALHRMRAGYEFDNLTLVAIPPLLREQAGLFEKFSQKHEITVECPTDLPPVAGEEEGLRQVLNNLLSNALKYSPAGGRVTLGARKSGEGVLLWVADQGVGVPEQEREAIFGRFYRASSQKQIKGTGLGLALAREMVQAHGGKIWVESTVGRGSTFFVQIPC